jgi:signal peptide peptidase SppA
MGLHYNRDNAAWLMEPNCLENMLRERAAFNAYPALHAEIEAKREAATKAIKKVTGKVAVLRLRGPVEQHDSDYLWWVGGTSTELFGRAFEEVIRDSSVSAVVIDIDSPGGSVPGTPELADKIYKARAVKPIYAVANSMAASAALWIATAATEFIVTPSGEAGSHGVWTAHADYSKALEMQGVKVSLVSAGTYKVEGNPWEELTEEAREEMQRGVDQIFGDFTKALALHRGVSTKEVLAKYGQGRMLFAKDALAAGLVDRISTLDDLLTKLTGDAKAADSRQARTNAAKARHSWRQTLESR